MTKPTQQQLRAEEQSLIGQLSVVDSQLTDLQRVKKELSTSLNKTRQRIKSLTVDKPIHLTDHVILQYLSRHEGVDVEAVRARLLTPELEALVKTLGGTGRYPVADGQVILQNYAVVTYIKPD